MIAVTSPTNQTYTTSYRTNFIFWQKSSENTSSTNKYLVKEKTRDWAPETAL